MSKLAAEKSARITAPVGEAFSDLLPREPSTMDFAGGTLERRSLAEQVANRIMAMIKSGNLKSGDRLPGC